MLAPGAHRDRRGVCLPRYNTTSLEYTTRTNGKEKANLAVGAHPRPKLCYDVDGTCHLASGVDLENKTYMHH